MTKKQTFLLVSLSDNKAKKLAEVIQNNTCRIILDRLSQKSATASELAKELGIPPPTIHYNLKQLVEARVVKNDEFHYSIKGKEVTHYSLAKQFIIIAPAGAEESIKEKLKTIIPTFTILGAAAVAIKLVSESAAKSDQLAPSSLMKAAPAMTERIAEKSAMMAADAGIAQQGMLQASTALPIGQTAPMWVWFLVGAASALVVYAVAHWIVKKHREQKAP